MGCSGLLFDCALLNGLWFSDLFEVIWLFVFLLWLGSFVFAGTLGFLMLRVGVVYGGGFDVGFGGGWISYLLFGSVACRFEPVQEL